jgi:predicted enzyme related to lactoylglutathione lyase
MANEKVIWFEINAKEPAKVAKFYKDAFGWEVEQWGGQDYWLIHTGIGPKGEGPGIDGAVGKHNTGQKVVNIVATDDVDKAVEKAVKAGAKVTEPKQTIPKVGHLVYLKDIEGIIFGILQPDMGQM